VKLIYLVGVITKKSGRMHGHMNVKNGRIIGRNMLVVATIHSEGKANPLQVWTGPEDSRRLRLPDLKTVST